MAIIYQDGFGTIPNFRPEQSGFTPFVQTGRDGIGQALGTNSNGAVWTCVLPSAIAHGFVGCGRYMSAAAVGGTPADNRFLLSLRGDAGATTHLTVNFDANGRLQLRRGLYNGTIIATSSHTPVAANTWHFYEIEWTIADAGGICKVRLDQVEVINFVGDTRNGGTNLTIDAIGAGFGDTTTRSNMDDLYVCDDTGIAPKNTFLGDVAIREQRANGNGATNQWIGSDGNSVDNYLNVDEIPFSTADYTGRVSTATAERDLYAFADLTGTIPTVFAVQVHDYAAKTDAGAGSIKTIARSSGGTVVGSAALPLSTTAGVVSGAILNTDPDGATWTKALVDSTQFGVEVA